MMSKVMKVLHVIVYIIVHLAVILFIIASCEKMGMDWLNISSVN